ncbi:MAG: OB-fold domain-containing protein [Bryobacter sp.]|nr:OB-fold domain-containing protein [Bryobacter sp.]
MSAANPMRQAVVYTETIIHSAPEAFAADAPYQIALVEFADGQRQLVRILGTHVHIGDTVLEADASPEQTYPLFTRKPQ